MSRILCSFERGGARYYFDFCTVADAPATCALKLREYKRYYFDRYGPSEMYDLSSRLKRADEKGTSDRYSSSLNETIRENRAGPKEGRVGIKKLLDLVLAAREDNPHCKPPRRKSTRPDF